MKFNDELIVVSVFVIWETTLSHFCHISSLASGNAFTSFSKTKVLWAVGIRFQTWQKMNSQTRPMEICVGRGSFLVSEWPLSLPRESGGDRWVVLPGAGPDSSSYSKTYMMKFNDELIVMSVFVICETTFSHFGHRSSTSSCTSSASFSKTKVS